MKHTILYSLLILYAISYAEQPAIGKTYFIMTEPTKVVPCTVPVVGIPMPPPIQSTTASGTVQILFTPGDDIRHHLLELIAAEQHAIYIAVFMMTDPEIANALGAACKRGVRVELVTDVGCLKDRASKIAQLCKHGCIVYIYNPTASAKGVSLMHNKFALFANTRHGSRTWTGSYNFTKAANNSNQENVVIFSDKAVFEKFFNQFKRLKSQSYQYTRDKITIS